MSKAMDLQAMKNLLVNQYTDIEIITHPENLKYLRNMENQVKIEESAYLHYINFAAYLYGIRVSISEALPQFIRHWIFPCSPFITYEETDEVWAIPLNFGQWIETDIPAFYKIDMEYIKKVRALKRPMTIYH